MISYAVKDKLIEYMETAKTKPGDALPSERALCRELGLNRNTLRAVIREMVVTGELIRDAAGRYLLPSPRLRMNLWEFNSLSRAIRAKGLAFERRLLSAGVIEADRNVARLLGVEPGTQVYLLRRLALVEGEPLVLEESRLVASCCPDLLRFDFAVFSLYNVLREEYGIQLKNQFIEVYAEEATAEEAGLLLVEEGAPLIVSRGYAHDLGGGLIELSVSKAIADRYEFEGYAGREEEA